MFITETITKKILENIFRENFKYFGSETSSPISDSLKFLGFYYATASGFSISLEDLKTIKFKETLINTIGENFNNLSKKWSEGLISDVDRFKTIMSYWNYGSDILKNKITDYFETFDPLNILHIMAFSGARGNMDQVRQVIGMRGLMVDQSGNIIDLPIQTSFLEGLSSIDYIVSSFGARKGVVDTALRTADAGYLTRRLIYVAQEITIKQVDCKTNRNFLFYLTPNTSIKNLIGRTIYKIENLNKKIFYNSTIPEDSLIKLQDKSSILEPTKIFYRSSILCESLSGVCQKCYGWDLGERKVVDLGSAVGIIAAQSIGEPGTQLTMRTFHTGGVYMGKSNLLSGIFAPCSGMLEIPDNYLSILSLYTESKNLPLLLENISTTITKWNGEKIQIFLPSKTYLHIQQTTFVKEGQIIVEYQKNSDKSPTFFQNMKIHPLQSPITSEIFNIDTFTQDSVNDEIAHVNYVKKKKSLHLKEGILFQLPLEYELIYSKYLQPEKAYAKLVILSPFSGLVKIAKDINSIEVINNKIKKIVSLNINDYTYNGSKSTLNILVKNYQYIDKYNILAVIYLYPNHTNKIYKIREKYTQKTTKINILKNKLNTFKELFFITDKNILRLQSDNPYILNLGSKFINSDNLLNSNLRLENNGIFIKKDGFKYTYQNSLSIHFPSDTILVGELNNFCEKNQILGNLFFSKQKSKDIVQGLPKIEEVFEAQKYESGAVITYTPSIYLGACETNLSTFQRTNFSNFIKVFDISISDTFQINKNNNIISNFLTTTKISQNKGTSDTQDSNHVKSKLIVNTLPRIKSKDLYVICKNNLGYKQYFQIENIIPDSELCLKFFKFLKPYNIDIISGQNTDTIEISKYYMFNRSKLFEYRDQKNNQELTIEYKRYLGFIGKNLEFQLNIENLSDFIFLQSDKLIFYSKSIGYFILKNFENSSITSLLASNMHITRYVGHFLDMGHPISEGLIDAHKILKQIFSYLCELKGHILASRISILKIQLILLNSIQYIYESQNVNIANNHIELILRQITTKGKILTNNFTSYFSDEIVPLVVLQEAAKIGSYFKIVTPFYEPIITSITKTVFYRSGFLAAAGFQETKAALSRAAVEGKIDWIHGLKECIMTGKLLPSGTAYLNYKHYLDNISFYKTKY